MNRNPARVDPAPVLDMSPLVDISFLLLVYFLVTSTLEPIESDLGMTLPKIPATHGRIFNFDPMTVEVNALGDIVVEGETLDTDATSREVPMLLDRLKTYAESARLTDSKPMVVIAADDASKGQRFVDVLNALASKGVEIHDVTIEGFKEK